MRGVGTRYNGYQQYLRYLKIMPIVESGKEFIREELVVTGAVSYDNSLHIVNNLIQEGVIEMCSYRLINGHKKKVYRKVK